MVHSFTSEDMERWGTGSMWTASECSDHLLVNCGVIIRGRKAMKGEIPKNRWHVEIALSFPRAFEKSIFMWLEI